MSLVKVNFDEKIGVIKPMNAVNNGPREKKEDQKRDNYDSYKALNIPYARVHDSASGIYGNTHMVDMHLVFPDFNADVNDPASYDFTLTDEYLLRINSVGTKVFYRLGATIEHAKKKYGTLVPPDFQKWAEIAEHVILHYNEGWADGFNLGIEYWEIWNEADLDDDDAPNKRTWSGNREQYFEMYGVVSKHLKNRFPSLKIGGPAAASCWFDAHDNWLYKFLEMVRDEKLPLDFYSWHIYNTSVSLITERAIAVRKTLDEYGLTKTENILDEWNYVAGWTDLFIPSVKTIIGVKGAAFTASVMLSMQNAPLDMLMYYDARPSTFNGLWEWYTQGELPTYYAFAYFDKLVKLNNQVKCEIQGENLYAVAACSQDKKEIMFSSYSDEKDLPERTITFDFGVGASEAKVRLTSEKGDDQTLTLPVVDGKITLSIPYLSVGYIEL